MTIDDQLLLFFFRYGEPYGNSKVSPEQALAAINNSRRSVAQEAKFYDVKDSITALGDEEYWTMRDDFLGLWEEAKDCVVYDGQPVTLKTLADWASLKNGRLVNIYNNAYRYGMLHGKQFYLWPLAEAGKVIEWWGYGTAPALAAITGGDAYLTSEQAEATVLDAVVKTKDANGDNISQLLLVDRAAAIKRITKKIAGPRLEPPSEG
jgi:hypothetical protein